MTPEHLGVQELIDHRDICDVLYAYARLADLNDPHGVAALFTTDCRVRYHPSRVIEGRSALVAAVADALSRYTRTSHHIGSPQIRFVDVDSADAECTVIAWHRDAAGAEWTLYGRYVDRLVRAADGWRIAERELRAAGSAGRDDTTMVPLLRRPL